MTTKHKLLLTGGILLLLIAGCALFVSWGLLTARDPANTEPTLVRVVHGDSAEEIAEQLSEKGLIRNALWFKVALRLQGAVILPGLYHVSASETPLSIVRTLALGVVDEKQITIQEGLRREEIAQKLSSGGIGLGYEQLLAASGDTATQPELAAQFQLPANQALEGFLFPDTYRFSATSDASEVIDRMVQNFLDRTAALSLTYDTVILASIVEREAKFDDDRALIAGVYANRLKIGMALNADPTVQYGLGSVEDWWPNLLVSHYQSVQSPYNTYLHAGLPPAPISNPGLKSLEAAAAPAEHGYFYFLTDSEGRAHFATTLAEHGQNKTLYLR